MINGRPLPNGGELSRFDSYKGHKQISNCFNKGSQFLGGTMPGMPFPRKVIISSSYGGGLYDWTYEMREDPDLISLVEAGITSTSIWEKVLPSNISYDERDTMAVKVATGPYVVRDNDGKEYLLVRDEIN